jgi:NDP-sugar pyrophosphorylase family protein
MIRDYFGDGTDLNISIDYLEEKEPMGTAGCLSLLPDDISDVPLILMNGDLITELNFASLLDNHNQSNSEATVCVAEYDFQVPYGVLKVKGNEVISIKEKPIQKFFVNAGIYVLDKSLLSKIEKDKFIDMPDILTKKLSKNESINTFPIFEKWIDIGRVSDFMKANEQLQK